MTVSLFPCDEKNIFSFASALVGPFSKFSTANHQQNQNISLTGIHFLLTQKEFLQRCIFRNKSCKSKACVFYLHMFSIFLISMIKLFLIKQFVIDYTMLSIIGANAY